MKKAQRIPFSLLQLSTIQYHFVSIVYGIIEKIIFICLTQKASHKQRGEFMAKRLIEFKMSDGSTIVVEANDPEVPGGVVKATRKPGEIIEEAKHSFEEALTTIQSASESAIAKLRTLSLEPDEVTMEFGFNLSATFGAVIASCSGEANYKVEIKWSGNKASKGNDTKGSD